MRNIAAIRKTIAAKESSRKIMRGKKLGIYMLLDPNRDNVPGHYHHNTKAGFFAPRPTDFWRFSPLRSEAEWERSGRRLDAEIALV